MFWHLGYWEVVLPQQTRCFAVWVAPVDDKSYIQIISKSISLRSIIEVHSPEILARSSTLRATPSWLCTWSPNLHLDMR
jgi:hypothetical protein